jgi:SH3-like domain-containing protein
MRFSSCLLAVIALGPVSRDTEAAAPPASDVASVPDSVVECDVEAYVIDSDPKGMNVRAGPGRTFAVVGNLPNADVDGIVVHITGWTGGDWVRIDRADVQGGGEDSTIFRRSGWVYGPLLGVEGVGWVPGGTKLHAEPSLRSRVVARMAAGDEGGTVAGCRGKWMIVQLKRTRGWAEPETTCSNSLTTCS